MDIRNFFGSSSSKPATSSLREGSESEEDSTNEVPPSKRPCAVPSSAATSRKYNKKWAKDFSWLEYDGNFQGTFCKICRKVKTRGQSSQGSGGVWVTKPFQNWKKVVQKMKEHVSSESHLRQVEAELIEEKQLYISCNVLEILREARTGKPSKHLLAALTTYANSTFLILPTSAS